MKNKNALVTASFGTTRKNARYENIEPVENSLKKYFSVFDVYRAFSSRKVVEIIEKNEGIKIENEVEIISRLITEDYENIIIQPLHIIPGYEYEKLKKAVEKNKQKKQGIYLGEPLLYRQEDYDNALKALYENNDIKNKDKCFIFLGHGTKHYSNSCYCMLQMKMSKQFSNAYICTAESFPDINDILPYIEKTSFKEIILLPFMLTAGDHAINDMAGDNERSCKSILEKKGYTVKPVLKGLGAYKGIQDMFLKKTGKVIKKINEREL